MDRILRITALAACGATLLWLSGCGGSSSADSAPKPKTGIAAEIEARNKVQAEQKATAEKLAAEQAEAARLAEAPSVATKDDMQRGHSLQGSKSYLGTVARTRFTAENQLQLHTITHALQLFWGSEGRYPKDTEEFMKRVIEPNEIQLPELAGDYEYWFNPKAKKPDEMLMKRPIGQADPVELDE